LVGAKVRDAKAVKPFLNMELIKLDGDKLLGFEEQLKNVKETKGFLFEEDVKPAFKTGIKQSGADGGNDKKEEANAALRAPFGKESEIIYANFKRTEIYLLIKGIIIYYLYEVMR